MSAERSTEQLAFLESVQLGSKSSIGRQAGILEGAPSGLRLGFGCAGLMRSASRRQRQRVLAEAFEHGIRHFDVARMYGLGAAEGELGRFTARRRDEVTISTKFGIDPSAPARLARFQAPARAAIARLPALRAAIKRRHDTSPGPRRYDGAAARRSLETSLKALGTDYVDFFFLHEPRAGDQVDTEGLGETLEGLRDAGRIRGWGLSGDPEPCAALRDSFAVAPVMQVRDEIFDPGLPCVGADDPPPTTFGVLATALERIRRSLCGSEERRRRWAGAVGRDCGDPQVLAMLLLQDALARNHAGVVLFSTTRPERIGAAVEAAEALVGAAVPPSLDAFRGCVQVDLGPGPERDA